MNSQLERFHYVVMKLITDHVLYRSNYLEKYNNERLLQRDLKDLRDLFDIQLPLEDFEKCYRITKEEIKNIITYGSIEKKGVKKSDKFFKDFIQKYITTIKLFQNIEKPDFFSKEEFDNFKDIIYLSKYPVLKAGVPGENIEKLLDAMKNLFKIEFSYYSVSPEKSFRVKAVPLILFFYQNRWYLIAKDIGRGNIEKKFILDIISGLTIMPEPLKITIREKENIEKEKALYKKERKKIREELEKKGNLVFVSMRGTPRKTVINVAKEVAYNFEKYDYGFSQSLKKNEDGSIDLSYKFSSADELWFTFSSWIPYIKVLSPKEFREDFKKRVMAYLEKNG